MTLSPNTTVTGTLIVLVETAVDVAVMVTLCPGGGTSGALYTPAWAMLPISPPRLLVLLTVQLTGTAAPPVAVAEQSRLLPEDTTNGKVCVSVMGSTQVIAAIAVAASIVMLAVPFVVLSAWETALMVTTLFVGTVEGAVYKPAGVLGLFRIDPKLPVPVPLTDQVTRVLLRFNTVAVH